MSRRLKIVYSYEKILEAVKDLAFRLHKDLNPGDGAAPAAVTFIVLLKGGARFAFELMSHYPGEYFFDFAGVSSYSEGVVSRGVVEFYYFALRRDLIDNRTVVLLDDICDTGLTFASVAARIEREFTPHRIKSCALIRRAGSAFKPDYYAFEASGEEYFVGYGLGMGEDYRHLNGIFSVTVV